jgi:hypothetical protein
LWTRIPGRERAWRPATLTSIGPSGVSYRFACGGPAKAFVLSNSTRLSYFDVSADVFDPDSGRRDPRRRPLRRVQRRDPGRGLHLHG